MLDPAGRCDVLISAESKMSSCPVTATPGTFLGVDEQTAAHTPLGARVSIYVQLNVRVCRRPPKVTEPTQGDRAVG